MPTSRPTQHPRGLRRTVLTAVVAGLLTSLMAGPTAAAPPGSADPTVPRLRWAPCGDGLECTTARVPLDHDRPSGATISLGLIRLPASGPGRRNGSVLLHPRGRGALGGQ